MPELESIKTQEDLDAAIKAAAEEASKKSVDAITAVREEKRQLSEELEVIRKNLKKLEDDANAAKSAKEKAELASQGKYDEALEKTKTEYQGIIAEKEKENAELKATVTKFRVDGEILKHASGAIKPEQVVGLIKSEYQIKEKDGGSVEILNADGTPVLDKESGKTLDIAGVTTLFLEQNPHMVKADSTGGAGTHPSSSRSGTNPWNRDSYNLTQQANITRQNPELAKKLKAEAQAK